MKRVKVLVPVILMIHDDCGSHSIELELSDSVSSGIDIIESDAIEVYESGKFELIGKGETQWE